VRVRAALAYGLLHAAEAPRSILLALLQDSEIIARAVVQYSPALIDADLVGLVRRSGPVLLAAIALRQHVSARLAAELLARNDRQVTLQLLGRPDVPVPGDLLARLAEQGADDPELRGALLARPDVPAAARLALVEAAIAALRGTRIVKGAVAPRRLERLLRNCTDTALTSIGEGQASQGAAPYASDLVAAERISTRVMLHAVVNGHVFFFADCVAALAGVRRDKVFSLLEGGSRAALNALLARCGLRDGVRNLVARLVMHARDADLADDVTARHFVVTALTEELIVEHDGVIPPDLEDAFAYLSEQNVMLARRAARGVMSAFADTDGSRSMPVIAPDDRVALPAA